MNSTQYICNPSEIGCQLAGYMAFGYCVWAFIYLTYNVFIKEL